MAKKIFAEQPLTALEGIDEKAAELLANHCALYTVGDLAVFPPYRHARSLCMLKGVKLSEEQKKFVAKILRRMPTPGSDLCEEKISIMREINPPMAQALKVVFGIESLRELADFQAAESVSDTVAQGQILSMASSDQNREKLALFLLLALSLSAVFYAGFLQKENWRKGKGAEQKQAGPNHQHQKQGQLRTYTVRKDDSLYKIAREQLGSPLRLREIYQLNPDKTGKFIHPGDVLQLPAE